MTWILIGALVLCAVLGLALGTVRRAFRAQQRDRAEMVATLDEQIEQLGRLAAHWENRFWSLHRASSQLIGERDGYKNIYRDSVSKHLEGQSVLVQALSKSRARGLALVKAINAERKLRVEIVKALNGNNPDAGKKIRELLRDKSTKPITDSEIDQLDGYPRQELEEYFEAIKGWSKRAVELDQELAAKLENDRDKWDEHYRLIAETAKAGPPAPSGIHVPPPSDSLEGITVQGVVTLSP